MLATLDALATALYVQIDDFLPARTLTNLADLYTRQRQYGKAEGALRRALAIWEDSVGPDHPSDSHRSDRTDRR